MSTTTPTAPPASGAATKAALFHPTVARLTHRALLGRRRAMILFALPALLVIIAVAVRTLTGADDTTAGAILGTFALGTMVPLIGVIAGTGAIGPEIDDGSVVYLLAKPVPRPTIIITKLLVAIGVTVAFSAIPILLAGFLLNGNSQQIAVGYAVAAAIASIAYSALFLLFGTITRHAVVFGLVYALVWESLFGNLVPGARTLSIQQWALALGQKAAAEGAISSDVQLPLAVGLLVALTAGATWYASRRLKALTLAGEE
ncbi:ABC transporter permease subunit [Streptomyces lydicus]|uniref:ABC transporter permease subunit n=1 Tax=Streptomyces lydicus TaxID=47763 RepID=UPI0009965695|nr:ABC transporter permease subunit [Streptomyces lydicus]MDC7337913.1 ABC transporter permease [Streptomyces lydicus]UEG92679.1 ABC transporter permease subunit [Streptomyces lydicus]